MQPEHGEHGEHGGMKERGGKLRELLRELTSDSERVGNEEKKKPRRKKEKGEKERHREREREREKGVEYGKRRSFYAHQGRNTVARAIRPSPSPPFHFKMLRAWHRFLRFPPTPPTPSQPLRVTLFFYACEIRIKRPTTASPKFAASPD